MPDMPHIMKGMLHIMKNTKLYIITAVRPDNVMARGRNVILRLLQI